MVDNDFESALETFGIDALIFRSIQLCPTVMQPILKDFRTSWRWLEIDRLRRSTGLTMRNASGVHILCRLLDPPVHLPPDKDTAERVIRGPKCSPWSAVLALRELGAFTESFSSEAPDGDLWNDDQ